MRILIVVKQKNYMRTFGGLVRELTARGHDVCVSWQEASTEPHPDIADLSRVEICPAHSKRSDDWRNSAPLVRRAADFIRYAEPAFRGARKLRARAFEKLLHTLSRGARAGGSNADAVLMLTDVERKRLTETARLIESSIPPDSRTLDFLRERRPDLMLISPLVDLGSGQADFVKAARALGIQTALLLYSWDNLTTKGTIHVMPDRLFVWNQRQKDEAIELHGVDPTRIVVAGAPRFDKFFTLVPVLSRDAFCAPLKFDPALPVLTYLCSSKFVSGDELTFLEEWLRAIRRSPSPLANANILIRPHPDVKVIEREGEVEKVRWPNDAMGRGWVTRPFADPFAALVRTSADQSFFECLHHSAAVVGLNTTAEIEAAIAGRPVFTVIGGSTVVDGQDTTLHFHYLLADNGGFVRPARGLAEHVAQLEEALATPPDSAAIRRFVQEFVRPAGVTLPVATVIADAVEQLRTPSRGDDTSVSFAATDIGLVGEATQLLDYAPAEIRLHVSTEMERVHRLNACAKEPWTVRWLESHVGPGDVLYDIGANVGTFSLIAATRGANVIAFEPGFANYARLCQNIVLNGCEAQIIPVPIPVDEYTRLTGFKYRSLEPGQSRHRLSPNQWTALGTAGRQSRYQQPMCAMRLDDAIATFSLPLPTHLKLDVDGSEVRVLAGAVEMLRSPTLRSVLIEVDVENWDDVARQLEGQGFVVRDRVQRTVKGPSYALFVRDPAVERSPDDGIPEVTTAAPS